MVEVKKLLFITSIAAVIYDFNSIMSRKSQKGPLFLKENFKVRSPMLCILCITKLVGSMENVLCMIDS